jgi:uncharacterized protein (DUF1684 family)
MKTQDDYEKQIDEFRAELKHGLLSSERIQLNEEDMKDIDFFPTNANFRVNASYVNIEEPDTILFPTSSGKTKKYLPLALLYFTIENEKCSLFVYKNAELPADDEKYQYSLFIPFTDITNGEETYGGGRYMNMDKRDFTDDSVIIDFNKAYNPWCVYGDGFSCPVPPKENDLELAIRAGEKMYRGKYYGESK